MFNLPLFGWHRTTNPCNPLHPSLCIQHHLNLSNLSNRSSSNNNQCSQCSQCSISMRPLQHRQLYYNPFWFHKPPTTPWTPEDLPWSIPIPKNKSWRSQQHVWVICTSLHLILISLNRPVNAYCNICRSVNITYAERKAGCCAYPPLSSFSFLFFLHSHDYASNCLFLRSRPLFALFPVLRLCKTDVSDFIMNDS